MLSRVYFKSFCAYVHVAKENILREELNFCVCVCVIRSQIQKVSRIIANPNAYVLRKLR